MQYEYLDDLATELRVQRSRMQRAVEQLGIETHEISVPPYGVGLALAVSERDAERIRAYIYSKSGQKRPDEAPR